MVLDERGRAVRALVLAALVIFAAGGSARAACYGSQQVLPASTIAQFVSKPTQLLSSYPNGGAQMITAVRDLVASDPAALPLVLDVTSNGNADQVKAIGTGLGQAALVCVRIDQTFANELQQMVVASNNQPLALAFTDVLGDQQLAAADPGGGGGGGGGGPTGNNGAFGGVVGGSVLNLTTAVKTQPDNFFTLGFTGTTSGLVPGGSPNRPSRPGSVSPSD
jgi:hypothetical protein